jgi:hypothetical protein
LRVGFTKLNELLAREAESAAKGQSPRSKGGEVMSRYLNLYFGSLIEVVERYGGDVLKIAGDALICHFAENTGRKANTLAATACALQMQFECGMFTDGDIELTFHCGVSSGDVNFIVTGGANERWEFTPTGPPFRDLASVLGLSLSGEVVVSADAFGDISDVFEGFEVDMRQRSSAEGGEMIITGASAKAPKTKIAGPVCVHLPLDAAASLLVKLVAPYVAEKTLAHLEAGFDGNTFLGESRFATVCFINLQGLNLQSSHPSVELVQPCVYSLQDIVHRHGGFFRQFLCDDKVC